MFAVSVRNTQSNPRTAEAIRAQGGRLAVTATETARRERERQLAIVSSAPVEPYAELQARLQRRWLAYAAAIGIEGAWLPAKTYRPRFARIVERLCRVYGVSPDQVTSQSRTAWLVLARQAICYWVFRLTRLSAQTIGKRLGGRNHATILHGIDAYRQKRASHGRSLREVRMRR